ncbi:MAG: hypothetical protein M3R00_07535, partial [Pseudomonadota bacterium]|nr:hypothetical protein [Pseudomonadota bacterium]
MLDRIRENVHEATFTKETVERKLKNEKRAFLKAYDNEMANNLRSKFEILNNDRSLITPDSPLVRSLILAITLATRIEHFPEDANNSEALEVPTLIVKSIELLMAAGLNESLLKWFRSNKTLPLLWFKLPEAYLNSQSLKINLWMIHILLQ